MKPLRLQRGAKVAAGLVLAQDVRDAAGKAVLAKGSVLDAEAIESLDALAWTELHVLEVEPGDLHEDEAGRRLAAAVAGDGVVVQPLTGGAWPLHARWRGLVELDSSRLAEVNALDDVILYLLPHHQIVLEGELLGRAKIVPFVTREEHIREAERLAAPGVLRVRRFVSTKVAAIVHESLEPPQLARFREAFEEKLRFFGSELVFLKVVHGTPEALAEALEAALGAGAELLTVAGSKPMDPLDPALQALERIGARMEKHGVPSHPGTLLWLAYAGAAPPGRPIIGMPSCGLFSKATVFDLLLPRLLAGEHLTRPQLAALGDGGLLSRDALWRFPPYRPLKNRGELDPP
jgi:hypothetical protein